MPIMFKGAIQLMNGPVKCSGGYEQSVEIAPGTEDALSVRNEMRLD
jgi:hypothetical protein